MAALEVEAVLRLRCALGWEGLVRRCVVDPRAHRHVKEVASDDRVNARDVSGQGYDYLLKSVVVGDRDMDGSTPLTSYHTEEGAPPGRWLGSGLHALGNGEIKQADEVTPQQIALLRGAGRDPVTGHPLGRAFPESDPLAARVAARIADLPTDLTDEQRRDRAATVAHEEVAAGTRRAVAGYDFTFSVPKSVSVLWGVAGAEPRLLSLRRITRQWVRYSRSWSAGWSRLVVPSMQVMAPSPRPTSSESSPPPTTTGTPGSVTRSSTPTSSSPTR